MRTWSFPQVHPPGPGPWRGEPDKAQWVDQLTGFDGLAVRGRMGFWCGYVGLPPGHPWHGVDPLEQRLPIAGVSVDFGSLCSDGGEDKPEVCHVPGPGRPADVWWLGWHNGHPGDLVPHLDGGVRTTLTDRGLSVVALPDLSQWGVYRTFGDVRRQVLIAAVQCADPWGTGEDWRTRPAAVTG